MNIRESAAIETAGAAAKPAKAEFRRGLAASLPVMIGFVPFATVLGAQAAQKGLHPVEVSLMTGLNFAGGSEFAAVELWTSPPHLLLIVAVTLLVNSRHLLMSAALAPHIQHLSKRKALAALFFMCDEAWALALANIRERAAAGVRPSFNLSYYFGLALGLYLTWVVFTAIGASVGPIIGDVTAYGFDMAFPAVFLVLLRGMWKNFRSARPWFVSLAIAALTYLLIPGAWYVPAGALSGVAAAYLWSREEE